MLCQLSYASDGLFFSTRRYPGQHWTLYWL